LVAESATRQGYLRHAYCLDFEDPHFSEWRNAKAVADRLGVELRRAVAGPIDPDAFAALVYHADDPLADSSAVAVDALSREVAQDYKVVVSGDGGDEVFGGYLTYKATALYKALRRLLPASGTKLLARLLARAAAGGTKVSSAYKAHRFLRSWGYTPAVAHFTFNGTWLPEEATELLADGLRSVQPVDQALDQLIARTALAPCPELRSLQMADLLEYLPHDILTKVDRMTMAHGLECRAPFLNPALVEFGMALESREKVRLYGKPKRLLRSLAQRIFPREISGAKKQGFSIPAHGWLRREMRDSLETFLSRERLCSMPFLDTDEVLARKNKHLAGTADLGFELWGLMALSAWWQHHTRRLASAPASDHDLQGITFPPCRRANAPSCAVLSL
jgi:asparagine synthase (glutamine-hydrolysing)